MHQQQVYRGKATQNYYFDIFRATQIIMCRANIINRAQGSTA